MKSLRDKMPNLSTQQLLESPIDALIIVDHQGVIQIVNSQTEQMFGYSRNDLLGQTITMLLPQRFRKNHEHHLLTYFKNPRMRPMGIGL